MAEYVHTQFKVNKIPTMTVKRKEDGQECVINKSDFDSEIYETERVAPTKRTAPAKRATKED